VEVAVRGDGSGVVRVDVAVDADAAKRLPPPATLVSAADLRTGGWSVDQPKVADDGSFRVEARKPFRNLAEADRALAQLSGPSGPFRDLRLERSSSFRSTRWRLRGTVDLSKGADTFGDPQLVSGLGGRDLAVLLQGLAPPGEGAPSALALSVSANLPGGHRATATTRLGDPARSFALTATQSRSSALWFVIVGALALVGFVVTLGWALGGTGRWGSGRRRRRT
jgi:hypothetical protein